MFTMSFLSSVYLRSSINIDMHNAQSGKRYSPTNSPRDDRVIALRNETTIV